jgi:hypothetical protein
VQGWGGLRLLESYEFERRPIAVRNTSAARQLTVNIGETNVDPDIEKNSPAGDEARRKAGEMLTTFGDQFASIGVQLGARYDGSPVIDSDGAPPADSFVTYTPSSVPGGRTPHFWLDNGCKRGSSLFDQLGLGFTLLRLGPRAPDASAMIAAAARRNIPLKLLDIPDDDTRDLYDCSLALVRPDQYVAWRGNQVAADSDRLFARVTGADR